ncbi:MAG: ABC transporter permease [Actinomycetes bacterium]
MRAVRRPELLVGALAAAAVALVPAVYLVVRVAEAGLGRILSEVATARVAAMTGRTLALVLLVWFGTTALGVTAALLTTRTDAPGRRVFGVLLALPLAVPSYVAAYTWAAVSDLWDPTGRFDGFWAAVLVLTLYSYPYVYLPVASALASQDPGPAEVARALGEDEWGVLRRVTLPGVLPAVASGGLLVALYTLSDFGAVSILRVDTFTRAVFTAFSVGFDRTGAVALASVLAVFALVIIAVERVARGAEKRYARVGSGGPRRPYALRLGWGRWPAASFLTALALVTLGVPLASLLRWFLAGVSRPGSLAEVLAAMGGSLGASLLGATLTVALAIPLGLYAARVRTRFARGLERLVYVTHSLPGVIIGLSLVFFGINVVYTLYQSVWLLALAYVTLFLPLASAAVASAARQAPPALEEAAESLGLTPMAALARVTLPVMLPGIGAGAALVFLTAMKELPATILLRPTGMDTLATRLWTYTSVEAYAAAAPYAAILIALAAVPTWFLATGSGAFGREHS